MPSVLCASEEARNSNNKKLLKAVEMARALENSAADDGAKKKKKSGKQKAVEGEGTISKEEKKKKKKRKTSDEESSETSSDHQGSPGVSKPKKLKLIEKEKGKASDEDSEVVESGDEEAASADPNAVSNFRISNVLREALKSKGIQSLFPIQAMTFDLVLDGSDLVGRARTGQGKTLAFVLPILESLTNGPNKHLRKTGYGRTPSVLVLLPTRELASQVSADFEFYGGAVGLTACCLYGGAPFSPQQLALRRGVDIVVGTPGRIKDHLERGTLNLGSLQFRVLDEADEMLKMGFVDDVELILKKVDDANKVQTLLFSATLPDWVKTIQARFLKITKRTVDLVGNEKLKASTSVRHLVLPCAHNARSQIIPDIIRCYSRGGRTIIFTETKDSASELAGLLPGARFFHGDVAQAQREVILDGFRKGRFTVLVATNVAARGLDITDVQLIIQCEPPRDVEAYIHRSGRTGRAGNSGVAVLLYEPRYSHAIARIERETGVKFERVSAPQPADVAVSAGSEVANAISGVSDSVIPVFRTQAEQLLASSGLSAVDLLAKALAKAVGYTDIKKRSLLSSSDNYVTLILEIGKPIYSPSFAYGILRRSFPDDKIDMVKSLSLTADGSAAVFDVPAEDVDSYINGEGEENFSVQVCETLPPLQEKRDLFKSGGGRRDRWSHGGGQGRFGGGRGGWRGGGGGSFSRGRGANRFGR